MRIFAFFGDEDVIKKILRHLGLWKLTRLWRVKFSPGQPARGGQAPEGNLQERGRLLCNPPLFFGGPTRHNSWRACSAPLFKAQGACHELCTIFVMRLLKKRSPWPFLPHFQKAKVLQINQPFKYMTLHPLENRLKDDFFRENR